MGTAAAAAGDRITGICPNHLVPGALGAPTPAPPLPFSAPLLVGVVQDVWLGGRPAVAVGCSGVNTPPHAGLHPADPFAVASTEIGRVLVGSPTVLVGGRPLARTGSSGTLCAAPGAVLGTVANVLVA